MRLLCTFPPWCFFMILLRGTSSFQLPSETAPSSGYLVKTDKIAKILEDKLAPVETEIHKIQKLLATNATPSGTAPRFTQKASTDASEGSSAAAMIQGLQKLRLDANAMGSLALLVSMFQNQEALRGAIPPGAPLMTLERLAGLISSSLSQTPDLNKERLQRLLDNWRNQLSNFPEFLRMPQPLAGLSPGPASMPFAAPTQMGSAAAAMFPGVPQYMMSSVQQPPLQRQIPSFMQQQQQQTPVQPTFFQAPIQPAVYY